MKRTLLALVLCAAGASAQAAPVFSDSFEGNSTGLNTTPSGWTVNFGTVDIIGNGFYDFIPGSGNYIDLDGSSQNAGELSYSLTLLAGQPYQLSFDLAGNQRNANLEVVTVVFGGAFGAFSLGQNIGWTGSLLDFTPSTTGTYTMTFSNLGGDGVGMLLDNVTVTAVPEPETYAMMLAGLGLLGFVARRRRT